MTDSERQSMEVDIVCVGFGPATGGFLTTLSRATQDPAQQSYLQSRVMPGLPLQVLCYERADDLGFGVSGVVTRGRGIRESFPDLDPGQIPMAHAVTRLFPGVKLAIGPAIDAGFYYDFDLRGGLTTDDLGRIEAEMHNIVS